jgi:hypothetical protein
MRGLKICLWIAGIGCLLSMLGLILPVSTLQSIAKFFGAESIPDLPPVVYLVRVMSASYAIVGIFFIILALRPMDYGIMVPFSGLAAVVLGFVCALTGLTTGMPAIWYLGDSLSCIVVGLLIVLFWQKAAKKTNTQTGQA